MESSEFITNKNDANSDPVIIGRGGTCELWRTMIHNKFHVLKQLKPEHKGSPQHIESLRREFEIGFQLDHPNIIRYLKYDSNSVTPSILLEFIDGSDLSEVINKHTITIPDESKRKIITQLCNAVDYLHSKQIYHLDLKPSNLMITFRGKNLKLIDFGHAVTDGDTLILGGTKEYMSPEQLSSIYHTSNDVYSIGKVIEFLYSNEDEKTRSKWIPIINKCLEIKPTNRYGSISDLLKSIETMGQKRISKTVLVSSISFVVIVLVLYLIIPPTKDKKLSQSDNSMKTNKVAAQTTFIDSSNFTKQTDTKKSAVNQPKNTFSNTDSIYCANLGNSLFNSFLIKYKESDKSMKSGSRIQTEVTDSIQDSWFKYSSKFEPESIEYRKAYDNYFPNFTLSQGKIMEHLYGSK